MSTPDDESFPTPSTPLSRDRWPEYKDKLALGGRAHRRLAERIMDHDTPNVPHRDWARRFDLSGAGWALMEAYPLGGGFPQRFVVYPINLSLTGAGVAHSAEIPIGSRVCIHFDRLVSGDISLMGTARRGFRVDERAWLIGICWAEEDRRRLVEHLGPSTSDAALRNSAVTMTEEQQLVDDAYRSLYAEGRLGAWAAAVKGD